MKLTIAAFKAKIQSLLPDNTNGEISEQDLRDLFTDATDSIAVPTEIEGSPPNELVFDDNKDYAVETITGVKTHTVSSTGNLTGKIIILRYTGGSNVTFSGPYVRSVSGAYNGAKSNEIWCAYTRGKATITIINHD